MYLVQADAYCNVKADLLPDKQSSTAFTHCYLVRHDFQEAYLVVPTKPWSRALRPAVNYRNGGVLYPAVTFVNQQGQPRLHLAPQFEGEYA